MSYYMPCISGICPWLPLRQGCYKNQFRKNLAGKAQRVNSTGFEITLKMKVVFPYLKRGCNMRGDGTISVFTQSMASFLQSKEQDWLDPGSIAADRSRITKRVLLLYSNI